MKENREVTDTNVEDIEEALEKLSTGKKIKLYELLRTFKREGIENFVTTRKKYVDVILSDYKRVLKINEVLLKENEMYKKNFEIMSKENLSTAEQLKVEIKENFRLKNQLENNRKEYQETYKDVREEIKNLKKENEEWQRAYQEEKDRQFDLIKDNEKLKEYIAKAPNLDEMTATKYRNIQQEAYIQGRAEEKQKVEQIIYENYISKQKVKDKISERQFELQQEYKDFEDDAILIVLQELIEESEDN